MTQDTTVEIITLRQGVCVPLAAILLALNLEERGVTVRLEAGVLLVSPRRLLTPLDLDAIRTHKDALKVLAAYESDPL
jgi:hypothetical protein